MAINCEHPYCGCFFLTAQHSVCTVANSSVRKVALGCPERHLLLTEKGKNDTCFHVRVSKSLQLYQKKSLHLSPVAFLKKSLLRGLKTR